MLASIFSLLLTVLINGGFILVFGWGIIAVCINVVENINHPYHAKAVRVGSRKYRL